MPSQSGKRVILTFAVFSALKSAPGRGHSLEPQRQRPRDGGGGRREAGGSRAAPRRARGYSARPRGRSSVLLPRPPRPFDRASSSRRRHQLQRARPGLAWLRRAGSPACSRSRGQAFRRVLGGQVHPPAPPRGRAHLRRRPGSEWRRKVRQPPAPHPAPHPAPCARSRSRHPGPVQVRGGTWEMRVLGTSPHGRGPRALARPPRSLPQWNRIPTFLYQLTSEDILRVFFLKDFGDCTFWKNGFVHFPPAVRGGQGRGRGPPRAASHLGGVSPGRRLAPAASHPGRISPP